MLTADKIDLANIVKDRITRLKEKIDKVNSQSPGRGSLKDDSKHDFQSDVSQINDITQSLALADKLKLARKLFEQERIRRSTENLSVDRSNSENCIFTNTSQGKESKPYCSNYNEERNNFDQNVNNYLKTNDISDCPVRPERKSLQPKERTSSMPNETNNYVKFSKGYQSKEKCSVLNQQNSATVLSESILNSVKDTLKQFGINTNDLTVFEKLLLEAKKGFNDKHNTRYDDDLKPPLLKELQKKQTINTCFNLDIDRKPDQLDRKRKRRDSSKQDKFNNNDRRSLLEQFINEDWVAKNILKKKTPPSKPQNDENKNKKSSGKSLDRYSIVKSNRNGASSSTAHKSKADLNSPPDLIKNEVNRRPLSCDRLASSLYKENKMTPQPPTTAVRRRSESRNVLRCHSRENEKYHRIGDNDPNESTETTVKAIGIKHIPSPKFSEPPSLQRSGTKRMNITQSSVSKNVCEKPHSALHSPSSTNFKRQMDSNFTVKESPLVKCSPPPGRYQDSRENSHKNVLSKQTSVDRNKTPVPKPPITCHKDDLSSGCPVRNTNVNDGRRLNLYETLSQAAEKSSFTTNERPSSCLSQKACHEGVKTNEKWDRLCRGIRYPCKIPFRNMSTPTAGSPDLNKTQVPVDAPRPKASFLGDVRSTSTYSSSVLNYKTISTPASPVLDKEEPKIINPQVVFSPGKPFQRCQSQECIQECNVDFNAPNHQRSQSVTMLNTGRPAGWYDNSSLYKRQPSFMMQTMSSWRRAQEVLTYRKCRESRQNLRPFKIPYYVSKYGDEIEKECRKNATANVSNKCRFGDNEINSKLDSQSVNSQNTQSGYTLYGDSICMNTLQTSQMNDINKQNYMLKEKRSMERKIERDKRIMEQKKWLEEEEMRRQVYNEYHKKQFEKTTPPKTSSNFVKSPSSLPMTPCSTSKLIGTPSSMKSINEISKVSNLTMGDKKESQVPSKKSARPKGRQKHSSSYHTRLEYDRQRRKNLMNGGITSPVTPCYASSSGDSDKSGSSNSRSLLEDRSDTKRKQERSQEEMYLSNLSSPRKNSALVKRFSIK